MSKAICDLNINDNEYNLRNKKQDQDTTLPQVIPSGDQRNSKVVS